MPETLLFYGREHPFSNYMPSKIRLDGKDYDTVEHYYQASKANNDFDHEFVRAAITPGDSKRRGHIIRVRDNWNTLRYWYMVNGLRAKFQIPEFKAFLLATGDKVIHEDSPTDFTWGWRNGGQDLLGLALMHVRMELQ